MWAGAALIIQGWHLARQEDRRPDLTERLIPFQPSSIADEAQDWLNRR